ncbi:MAG TPA: hypothetical protein VHP99_13825, partial [Pyrinomonadaceae bacterium]|nr:hypothetical protein [Pyrinomonadaceae bacterium]
MRFEHYRSLSSRRAAVLAFVFAFAAVSLLIVGASSAQQPDSRQRQTGSNPAPTATPVEQTGPGRKIAPQLGAPPPAPLLKPKPTPVPDPNGAEISENERLTIDTELVTLHVRV